jgi:hypothetical protein
MANTENIIENINIIKAKYKNICPNNAKSSPY